MSLKEQIEAAKTEIGIKIGDLEDRIEVLRNLLSRIEDITSYKQAEAIFQSVGAWYFYDLNQFGALISLAYSHEEITAESITSLE